MLTKFKNNGKGFTLIELMIVVAILAILSMVAVPAFIKYMRKAKTSEAVDMLDKIYKGAADYYGSPRVEKGTGDPLECQFPTSQAQTPTEGTCCGTDDERCDADASRWDTPTWSALKFQINEEHYFIYTFDSAGVGSDAAFTATANADLDCDGTYSTFQRYANGDPAATKSECAIKGAGNIFSNLETE